MGPAEAARAANETDAPAADGGRWAPVARSGQVPDGWVRRLYADKLEICVARMRGRAYATSNYCTHLDCLLSAGKVVDDGIGCSCHGSVFDLETGEAVYPPATVPIRTYPVREEDGEIYVYVTDADIADGGPRRRNGR
jgi:3-phenylpropionate/trans-cinnamate dioxygenase ferredoxin subunit